MTCLSRVGTADTCANTVKYKSYNPWCSRKKKKHVWSCRDYDGMCILSYLYVYTYIVHIIYIYIYNYIYISLYAWGCRTGGYHPSLKTSFMAPKKVLGLGCSHPGIGSPTWEPSFGSQTPSNPTQHPIPCSIQSLSRHRGIFVCQISESPLFGRFMFAERARLTLNSAVTRTRPQGAKVPVVVSRVSSWKCPSAQKIRSRSS